MRRKQTAKDLSLLDAVAEFRVATVTQLATWLDTSEQMVRRRCCRLVKLEFLEQRQRGYGRGRGRPEGIFSVTADGVTVLKQQNLLPATVPIEKVTAEKLVDTIEHQLLVNRVDVQARLLERSSDTFAVSFVSSTSPHHLTGRGTTTAADYVRNEEGEDILLMPDAVMCITSRSSKKSLLFFLEVDMGTENLTGKRSSARETLAKKVSIYRRYLGTRGYKKYEKAFDSQLRGFRVLLLCSTSAGKDALCRLVSQMRPSDFIWVGDTVGMGKEGLGGRIWARGGHSNTDDESVAGE